jgi:hypothetical protein
MNITTGTIQSCEKVIIYGPEGVGKSTLASKFPNPLAIDTEGSTKKLDMARLDRPTSWPMLMDQIQHIKADHMGYLTLIVDTADWAELLCSQDVCNKNSKAGIEDFGYGKGYQYLAEEFAKLLHLLEDVVESGMHVVITAHATLRKFDQPDEMGSYDRWSLKLQKKTAPLLMEWADMVLFANYKTYVINVDGQGADKGKNKAQGGKRVMYTSHHPAWDAKNRHGLPEELDMDYASIAHLFSAIPTQVAAAPVQQTQPIQANPQPQQQAPAQTQPAEANFDAYVGIQPELAQLLAANNVTELEIREVVAAKGYYPMETPVKNYDDQFALGALVGAWDAVHSAIKTKRGNK